MSDKCYYCGKELTCECRSAPPPAADGRGKPPATHKVGPYEAVAFVKGWKVLDWNNQGESVFECESHEGTLAVEVCQILGDAHAHGWQAAMRRAAEIARNWWDKSDPSQRPYSSCGDDIAAALDHEASNGGESHRQEELR